MSQTNLQPRLSYQRQVHVQVHQGPFSSLQVRAQHLGKSSGKWCPHRLHRQPNCLCLVPCSRRRDTHIRGCYGLHGFRGRPKQHWGQQTLGAPVTPLQAQSPPVHKEHYWSIIPTSWLLLWNLHQQLEHAKRQYFLSIPSLKKIFPPFKFCGSETSSCYVALAGLKLTAILLPQPPGC